MSKWAKWTDDELMRLGFLINAGFTNPEIAELMRKPRSGVQIKANRIWGGNPNYRIQKTKHAHLREPVFRYFLKHTWEETKENFGLTDSELKSIFTVGYRDAKLKHLRKETRRHDPWTVKELQFLLQHAGLKPRKWIGKKLKRGGEICIKDRLEILGISSKSINGITLSQYREAFGRNPKIYLMTKAGPGRGTHSATFFKIIPWVRLKDEMENREIRPPKVMAQLIDTMAMFQDWIFEGNALKKMGKIVKVERFQKEKP